ncbi:hypothetical protein HQ34_07255 [Porphyromonas cangingivalis]|nr:hypothetical protein HQ34_07255 [Porphyromonas cangingivalis]
MTFGVSDSDFEKNSSVIRYISHRDLIRCPSKQYGGQMLVAQGGVLISKKVIFVQNDRVTTTSTTDIDFEDSERWYG